MLILNLLLNGALFGISTVKKYLDLIANISAFVLGFLVFAFGGIGSWVLLLAFFISSSLLTYYAKKRKKTSLHSSKRKINQVIANGLPALIYISLYALSKNPLFLLAYATALASCSADTWATEIGSFSKRKPFSLSTFRPVVKGRSGAISALGTLAGLTAALLIGALAGLLYWPAISFMRSFIIVSFCGFIGAFLDSVIGATLQAQYRSVSGAIVEQKFENGKRLELLSGIGFVNNDVVNFSSSLIAGALALSLSIT